MLYELTVEIFLYFDFFSAFLLAKDRYFSHYFDDYFWITWARYHLSITIKDNPKEKCLLETFRQEADVICFNLKKMHQALGNVRVGSPYKCTNFIYHRLPDALKTTEVQQLLSEIKLMIVYSKRGYDYAYERNQNDPQVLKDLEESLKYFESFQNCLDKYLRCLPILF